MHVISLVLKKTMNLQMMGGGDEIFFMDDDRNCLNIVAFHRYEKIKNVEEFRKTLLQRACKFPRLKSIVTKAFGKYMF